MSEQQVYLTVHGHFYQPPRENPWLESIELQDSALPFHDWNARINNECYDPNSVARIVSSRNQILDIVNNYSLMSFNIGPTLLSWLEANAPKAYERIIEADRQSLEDHSGHGNAVAQNYNHIIMPLASEKDKYTQVIWGIKDFKYRFGRNPEGMWLAETAIDYETIEVLIDCGIKFTILSPYQAAKVRKIGDGDGAWCDVSWGNIDPGQPYRYYLKDGSGKYLDLFFYDGSISKSVAFENLLQNGDKFINRLKDGISASRNYSQLVNIATDGESYGHHTKFGDMALAYALKKRAEEVGFKITNYGEFLEKFPPIMEAELKEVSSWSCFHGVGRWKEDCGCSTGAQAGWNQKWRKPLREALDWLRDELSEIYEKQAARFFEDPWVARNRYIDVILDRNGNTIDKFFKGTAIKKLSHAERVEAIKLLEMQRQSMLMFTSCGWFFAELSGIEPVQIMKYAARAMQIAEEFSERDIEGKFLNLLSYAFSNIPGYGTGRDIYLKFVKPSIVSIKQVVSHWAISSLYEDYENDTDVYCYNVKVIDYRKITKANTALIMGHIEATSKVTTEHHDLSFALLYFGGDDFHCVIRGFTGNTEYNKIKDSLIAKYQHSSLTEVIRTLDEYFGREYYTLKDLFLEEKRKVINILIKDQLTRFSSTYKELYEDGKGPMAQLIELGLQIPNEFKIASEYTLSRAFNDIIISAHENDEMGVADALQDAFYINDEAEKIGVSLDRATAEELYSSFATDNIKKLSDSMEMQQFESIINVLSIAQRLKLNLELSEAQNIYFNSVYSRVPELIKSIMSSDTPELDRKFVLVILNLGDKLNFNIEKYHNELSKLYSKLSGF